MHSKLRNKKNACLTLGMYW